jgi:hypothetical protein
MAVTATFDEMLTEKLHPELLKNEIVNRTDILKKIEMDNSWKGGVYAIGFREATGGSVQFDSYTAESDIAEATMKRGELTAPKSLTGSMKFNHKDLISHDTGKISEASFLKILPGALDDFANDFRAVLAQSLLNGKVLAYGTADATAGGVLQVDRIERFKVGQKVQLEDDDTALAAYYVTKVDKSNILAPKITLSATRGGAAADLSALDLASTIKIYHPGAKTAGFTSIRDILSPDTTALWGLNKADYSFLTPAAVDGSAYSTSNILDKLFDHVSENQIINGSDADEVWVSGRKFSAILKLLEGEKKNYNVVPGSQKVSKFGWREVQIGSMSGVMMTIVCVPEMDDDMIMVINPKDFKFASNGFIRQVVSPDGNKYHTVRGTSGYYYVCDWEVFGELVCLRPAKQLFIYDVPAFALS